MIPLLGTWQNTQLGPWRGVLLLVFHALFGPPAFPAAQPGGCSGSLLCMSTDIDTVHDVLKAKQG